MTEKKGDGSVAQRLDHGQDNKENSGGFSAVIRDPSDKMDRVRDQQILQKSMSHCRILDTSMVTCAKFRSQDPQIQRAVE